MDMTIQIVAHPIDDHTWAIDCSVCGPIGVCEDSLTGSVCNTHMHSHTMVSN